MNYFYMDPLYCQQLSFYIRVWALPFSLPLKCFSDLFFIFYIVTPNCFGIQLLATVIIGCIILRSLCTGLAKIRTQDLWI